MLKLSDEEPEAQRSYSGSKWQGVIQTSGTGTSSFDVDAESKWGEAPFAF